MAARSPRPFVVRLTELLLNRVTAVTPRVRAFMKRLSMHRSLQPFALLAVFCTASRSLRRHSRLRAKHLRETAAAHHRPHRLCQPRHPGWLASSPRHRRQRPRRRPRLPSAPRHLSALQPQRRPADSARHPRRRPAEPRLPALPPVDHPRPVRRAVWRRGL